MRFTSKLDYCRTCSGAPILHLYMRAIDDIVGTRFAWAAFSFSSPHSLSRLSAKCLDAIVKKSVKPPAKCRLNVRYHMRRIAALACRFGQERAPSRLRVVTSWPRHNLLEKEGLAVDITPSISHARMLMARARRSSKRARFLKCSARGRHYYD